MARLNYEDFYKSMKKLIEEDEKTTIQEKSQLLNSIETIKPFAMVLEKKKEELELTEEENYILSYLIMHDPEEKQPKTAKDVFLIPFVTMMFVHQHKETVLSLNNAEKRKDFIDSLTEEDLEEIKLSKETKKVADFLSQKEPTLDSILDVMGFGNAIYIYEKHNNKYRTKKIAKEAGAITEAPKSLITPTYGVYQYGMSLYKDSNGPYLQPLSSMDNLQFRNGKLYFSDARMKEVSEAELRDLRTKEGIQNIDLITLRFYYSILCDQFQRSGYKVLQDFIIVSVPLLAGRNNPKQSDIDAVINKVKSYHNIMGVIKGKTLTGKPAESYYQVLNFEYYDKDHNIIAFSSPYMNYVIKTIYNLSIKKDKNGKPKIKKNGDPLLLPSHSYLIDSSIVKERNKAAVENVIILVTLIERAGGSLPNIKVSTLIERNVQLAERLNKDHQHRAQQLKRVFTKTWELMQKKTKLTHHYKNLRVSINKNSDGVPLDNLNTADPAFIPTVKNLNNLCFYFPNEGKG